MADLTVDKRYEYRLRGAEPVQSVPMAASVVIKEGAYVALNSSGYAVNGDASQSVFLGLALEAKTGGASAGDEYITVSLEREILIKTLTGVALTDVGESVYLEDYDNEYTLSSTGHKLVGTVTEYVGTDSAWVYLLSDSLRVA